MPFIFVRPAPNARTKLCISIGDFFQSIISSYTPVFAVQTILPLCGIGINFSGASIYSIIISEPILETFSSTVSFVSSISILNLRHIKISPASNSGVIFIKHTPLSVSPFLIALRIGDGPRYFGNKLGCRFTHGAEFKTLSRNIAPYAATNTISGAKLYSAGL